MSAPTREDVRASDGGWRHARAPAREAARQPKPDDIFHLQRRELGLEEGALGDDPIRARVGGRPFTAAAEYEVVVVLCEAHVRRVVPAETGQQSAAGARHLPGEGLDVAGGRLDACGVAGRHTPSGREPARSRCSTRLRNYAHG